MASDRLATRTVARSEGELATYLSDLAAELHGPRRRREAILTELRDGLEQATEDRIASGLASPTGRPRRRSPSSEAHTPSRTPSPAS